MTYFENTKALLENLAAYLVIAPVYNIVFYLYLLQVNGSVWVVVNKQHQIKAPFM